MADPRTVLEFIGLATKHFKAAGIDTPRLDAEVLMGDVLSLERIQLYVQHDRPLISAEVNAYRAHVQRRARREPVAYIVGGREFRSIRLKVDRRVLIPRPETELLVDEVQAALRSDFADESDLRVADIGTGSGAVAIGVAIEAPCVSIVATDLDESALAVAQENARNHGVHDRIHFRRGDLAKPLAGELFHGIVSNPPYVPELEWSSLEPEVRSYEPKAALVGGGDDGLDIIRRLIASAPALLHPNGFLALEMGASQGDAVKEIALVGGFASCRIVRDLAGRDRIAVMRRNCSA